MQHSSFMPHGICYLWKPELVWLHVISDSVIALAYYAIPPTLIYLVIRTRREAKTLGTPMAARGLPYEWVYLAFGLFIVACGTTHVLGVWNVWNPSYWISGSVKAVTAVASVATAIALPPLMPKAIALFREARISELQHTQLSQLAAIVEYSDDAIITKDLHGRVLTWNEGAHRLYGYAAPDIVGKPIQMLLPADRKDEIHGLLRRIARGESIEHYETVRVKRDGSNVAISLTVSPIRSADGRVVAASAIARDISQQKEAQQQQLRLAQEQAARAEAERLAERFATLAADQTRLYEQAEAVSRAKSEFLAVMSHELRTPLNAIAGYTDILDAEVYGKLNDEQHEQLLRIRRSGDHLKRVIDQVLVHTKLEAGRVKPEISRVNLRGLVSEAVQLIEPALEEKQLGLTTDVPDTVELETDPTYLRQILLNLFSNAVKFTASGEIAILARYDADDVLVSVKDTGKGIAAEHLEKIFEPFWQVEQGRSRSAEGAGLGLTVAQRLARLLGGRLSVSSELGRGTEMRLHLPRRPEISMP